MSTCYQNALLLINTMTTPSMTFRERPCIPFMAASMLAEQACSSVTVECANGTLLEFYKDGTVHETLPHGDQTLFPPKPRYTLSGDYTLPVFEFGYLAFESRTKGNYFEFNTDGSVVYRHDRTTFLWGPEFPTQEVEGVARYSMRDYDAMDECRDSYS